MILHAPVMALLLVAALGALALAWAGAFGLGLLRHWDPASGSRRQLDLERRGELVGTVVALVAGVQGLALVLMVFNADRSAPLLVGAMCAYGVFNASAWGFPALGVKMALFFAATVWLALHRTDLLAGDWPLTRRKAALLLPLAALALADAALSLAFHLDLQPHRLTSCCGSAFRPEQHGLGAEAAALDPHAMLAVLAVSLVATLAWAALAGRHRVAAAGYALASVGFLGIALAAVVAAVSLYVYEHPHHHCPFCLLKREYGYVGFALYVPLFGGAAAGLASGVLSLRPPPSLRALLVQRLRRLRLASATGFALFGLLCAGLVWRSGLRL